MADAFRSRQKRLFMSDHRKELMQRVQIGLTGLAGVVLLVGLANVVIEKAAVDEAPMSQIDGSPPQVVPTTTDNSTDTTKSEPLAELGVTPPPPEEATPTAKRNGAAPEQMVPDLEPNPALKERMDR